MYMTLDLARTPAPEPNSFVYFSQAHSRVTIIGLLQHVTVTRGVSLYHLSPPKHSPNRHPNIALMQRDQGLPS